MTQFVQRFLFSVIFLLSASMFLAVFAQVVFRYVLAHPLPWSEELARYLMIWVACLAASEAYRRKSHVGVALVADLCPEKFRNWFVQIAHLAVLILMMVIIYQGFRLSWMLMDQASPALEIPMTLPYLAVPVGAVFVAIHAFVFLLQGVRKTPPPDGNDLPSERPLKG